MARVNPRQILIRLAGLALLHVLLYSGLTSAVFAQDASKGVLVIVVNRLSLYDIESDTSFQKFLKTSTVGLVSPSSLGSRSTGGVFASASTGAYSRGSGEFGQMFNFDAPFEGGTAAEAHLRRVGPPIATSGLVHLGVAEVLGANLKQAQPPEVWKLGQTLRDHRVLRAAFGNADIGDKQIRLGAALFADFHGLITRGDVEKGCLHQDASMPGGYAIDLKKLEPLLLRQLRDEAVTVLDFGDLDRIETQRFECTPAAYRTARASAVTRLFHWIQQLRTLIPYTPIVVISLIPTFSQNGEWNSLGLAAITGPKFGNGILTSNSTRTPGIVTAVDIAPTILGLAGIDKPQGMIGYPVQLAEASDPIGVLTSWNQTVMLNHDLQFAYLLILGIAAGLAGLAATTYLLIAKPTTQLARIATLSLAVIAWIPPMFLIPLNTPELFGLLPIVVLGSLVGNAYFLNRFRFLPLEIPSIILLAGVLGCLFGLSDWLQRSPLSAYQLSGFRFYGLGNEWTGCVLGATCVMPLWRHTRGEDVFRPTALALWFAFWTLIIGLPALGADFGGAVAAVVMYGLVFRAIFAKSVTWRDATLLAFAGIVLAAILTVIDAALAGANPTHLGLMARNLGEGKPDYLLAIVIRKALMNISLFSRIETKTTIVIIGSILALWLVYRDKILRAANAPPQMIQGILGMAYGSGVALALNDSGIVTVGFVVIFVMAWWLWDAVTQRSGGAPKIRIRHAINCR